jgi:hypothetical protein
VEVASHERPGDFTHTADQLIEELDQKEDEGKYPEGRSTGRSSMPESLPFAHEGNGAAGRVKGQDVIE